MTEFLHTVAAHYFLPLLRSGRGAAACLEVTDWMFVFPNRRAGLFFNYYLGKLNDDKPLLSPQCTTIGDLFSLFSDLRVADRTELLFRLFRVYNQVRYKGNVPTDASKFENFIFWGEMMLRDFDEVDKYLVDAEKLFHNVRDIKEIEEEFSGLEEEQLKALRTFWTNVNPASMQAGSAKESFTQTWSILFEVYDSFRKQLRSEGLAYEGMRQRDVVEHQLPLQPETMLQHLPRKIVLVGITAINQAERELLLWLKKNDRLECCWDYADANVQDLSFVRSNLRDFGNALSDNEAQAGIIPVGQKRLYRMAVPSGVGQATEAARVLNQWDAASSIESAVVLSDEHLLSPLIYNIPAKHAPYNVTMGCSLRTTPVATLVDQLIFLQNNARLGRDRRLTFFYKAVLPLLSHSFLLELSADDCTQLHSRINAETLYQVPQTYLTECQNPLFDLIFRHEQPIPYLHQVLHYLLNQFESDTNHVLDRECLISYLQMLDVLQDEIRSSGMTGLDDSALFHLILKLGQGLSVSYSGEPMKGLQVMGVLETRALDFRRMVVLSMNEGVVPAKPSQNSFIPRTLREAFGLPTQIYKDLVFAYHFYRMISRAEEVVFIYDSRATGMQTGEQSRYLLQMQYLDDVRFVELTPSSNIITHAPEPIIIDKTPDVRVRLNEFLSGGNRRLSASSLKTFIDCPLQFYFAHVCHLSLDDELEDEMGNAKFGDIVHHSLQNFYEPYVGKEVSRQVLQQVLDDKVALPELVKRTYQSEMGTAPDTGYDQLICSLVANNVRSILQHDLDAVAPFYYLASECRGSWDYEVDPGLTVRLTAVYDRMDIRTASDASRCLRVVDYKTGGYKSNGWLKCRVPDITALFESGSKLSKEAFQVLFYCLMLGEGQPDNLRQMHLLPATANNQYQHLEGHLYFSRLFLKADEENKTLVQDNFEDVRPEVEHQVKDLLRTIFGPEPFRQCDDEHTCTHCKFIQICNKTKQNE